MLGSVASVDPKMLGRCLWRTSQRTGPGIVITCVMVMALVWAPIGRPGLGSS